MVATYIFSFFFNLVEKNFLIVKTSLKCCENGINCLQHRQLQRSERWKKDMKVYYSSFFSVNLHVRFQFSLSTVHLHCCTQQRSVEKVNFAAQFPMQELREMKMFSLNWLQDHCYIVYIHVHGDPMCINRYQEK